MLTTYRSELPWLTCPYPMRPLHLWFALFWLRGAEMELLHERQREAHRIGPPNSKITKFKGFGDLSLPYRFINNHFEMPKTLLRIVYRYAERRELAAIQLLGKTCKTLFRSRFKNHQLAGQFDVFAVWASYCMTTDEPVTLDNFDLYSSYARFFITEEIVGNPAAAAGIAERLAQAMEANFPETQQA